MFPAVLNAPICTSIYTSNLMNDKLLTFLSILGNQCICRFKSKLAILIAPDVEIIQ